MTPAALRPHALALPDGAPLLRIGAADAPAVLILQPLLEEANRCRALVAGLCRALAEAGLCCWLPDLPGTGEDLRALDAMGWDEWTACVAAAAEHARATHIVSLRGGALLDAAAGLGAPRWRLSPVAGASLLTDLRRTALAGGDGSAGYPLSPALRAALAEAQPRGAARTVRLEGDARAYDRLVAGPALWRRGEPAGDAALAATLAADILAWVRG